MARKRARLLLLNGPNLNMLGRRDPAQYGTWTLVDVVKAARAEARQLGYRLDAYQTNHEGALVEVIQRARMRYCGLVINAGALTHYSYALHDALELCGLPAIEVHLSNIHAREPWRHVSVIQPACRDQVAGLGLDSYREGVRRLVALLAAEEAER